MDKAGRGARHPALKLLDRMDRQIGRLEGILLAVGVIAMTVNTIAGVVSRFVFNSALTVTDELNVIFIVLVTFAGLSYAARQGRHIRMSAIYDLLPARGRKALMVLIAGTTSACMFFLAYYSGYYIKEVYESGRVLPALGLPVFYIYLWVPLGFVMTGLQYAFTAIKNLAEKEVYLSTYVKDGYADPDNAVGSAESGNDA
ncbi:MAG: TRAP transporter small permease subunit [Verrucomicrobia bacterium]|jgi:TRAP-type C4-dicarboxylate transport system permease small subunit|nr:TRAP transporter small permease subunit [Verrucomicrobiota bacterium]